MQSGCSMCTQTFQRLTKDVLELSWQEFPLSSPPKTFNHQKERGVGERLGPPQPFLYVSSSIPPSSEQPCPSPQKQHIWKHPPHLFLVFATPLQSHVKSADSDSSKTPCQWLQRTEGQSVDWLADRSTNTLAYIFIHLPSLFSLDPRGAPCALGRTRSVNADSPQGP